VGYCQFMGFGKKGAKDDKKVRDEKEEKEQAEKKDDDVDTTTGPITAATVSGFTIGM
jgi:hypothetical protein